MPIRPVAEQLFREFHVGGVARLLFRRLDFRDLLRAFARDIVVAQARLSQNSRQQLQRLALVFLQRRHPGGRVIAFGRHSDRAAHEIDFLIELRRGEFLGALRQASRGQLGQPFLALWIAPRARVELDHHRHHRQVMLFRDEQRRAVAERHLLDIERMRRRRRKDQRRNCDDARKNSRMLCRAAHRTTSALSPIAGAWRNSPPLSPPPP